MNLCGAASSCTVHMWQSQRWCCRSVHVLRYRTIYIITEMRLLMVWHCVWRSHKLCTVAYRRARWKTRCANWVYVRIVKSAAACTTAAAQWDGRFPVVEIHPWMMHSWHSGIHVWRWSWRPYFFIYMSCTSLIGDAVAVSKLERVSDSHIRVVLLLRPSCPSAVIGVSPNLRDEKMIINVKLPLSEDASSLCWVWWENASLLFLSLKHVIKSQTNQKRFDGWLSFVIN